MGCPESYAAHLAPGVDGVTSGSSGIALRDKNKKKGIPPCGVLSGRRVEAIGGDVLRPSPSPLSLPPLPSPMYPYVRAFYTIRRYLLTRARRGILQVGG